MTDPGSRVSTLTRPTPAQVAAAHGRTLPDVIGPGLAVLFVGINPSLYSAAIGHHFGRPGNRFWPTVHRAGFTDHLLHPHQDRRLLEWGCGLTNLVSRAAAAADELRSDELTRGAAALRRKIRNHRPACVAVLGIGAYRAAFRTTRSAVGPQTERVAGAAVWVLPNPSGLNAHYQLPDLIRIFRRLRRSVS